MEVDLYFIIVFFIFGTVLGSFYNVVGYRLPKGESLIRPASHCTNCGHFLKPYELVPIFSWLFLGRKCSKCKQKISWFYPVFELSTGLLFALSYILFGLSIKTALSLTLISVLLIIIISDYQTMIIPDEVLIVGVVLSAILLFIMNGGKALLFSLLSGAGSFLLMYGLKTFGDIVFKKESMGGGDIKLMFLVGMVLGFRESIMVIFLSAIIALPVSLIILIKKKDHILPFGPFISVATLVMFLSGFNFESFLKLFGA